MILTNLVKSIETFVDAHSQIKSFNFGAIDELDIKKNNAENYPILYAVPSTVTIERGQAEVSLDLIICQPYFDGDRPDQLQQMLSIMGDLIAFASNSTNQVNGLSGFSDVRVISQPPFTCEPFLARFDNTLIGWSLTIDFEIDYTNNFCLVPLEVGVVSNTLVANNYTNNYTNAYT